MTGIREASNANERALVRSMPDGLLRALLPEAWPHDETEPPANLELVKPPVLSRRERLLSILFVATDQVRAAIATEAGRGAFFSCCQFSPVLAQSSILRSHLNLRGHHFYPCLRSPAACELQREGTMSLRKA